MWPSTSASPPIVAAPPRILISGYTAAEALLASPGQRRDNRLGWPDPCRSQSGG
jgi:hypothetical protein